MQSTTGKDTAALPTGLSDLSRCQVWAAGDISHLWVLPAPGSTGTTAPADFQQSSMNDSSMRWMLSCPASSALQNGHSHPFHKGSLLFMAQKALKIITIIVINHSHLLRPVETMFVNCVEAVQAYLEQVTAHRQQWLPLAFPPLLLWAASHGALMYLCFWPGPVSRLKLCQWLLP